LDRPTQLDFLAPQSLLFTRSRPRFERSVSHRDVERGAAPSTTPETIRGGLALHGTGVGEHASATGLRSAGMSNRTRFAAAGRIACIAFAATVIGTFFVGDARAGTTPLPVGDVERDGGVTRTVLASVAPPNGPGTSLYLTRVRIAPRTSVPEHVHAGTQVARIERGVLGYEILVGSAVVDRADGTQRSYTAPKTVTLRPGDVVSELPGMVHRARNATEKAVIVTTAALVESTAALSTPVDAASTGTVVTTDRFELVVDSRDVTTVGPAGVRSYGTVVEHGTAIIDGETVRVDITVQVDYTEGSGPWTGILTITWPDGSRLGATIAGATLATTDGGAQFGSTLGVIGGSGRYAAVTGGSGTYMGSRPGAIGAPLSVEVSLRLVGV
jgi:quercetin dioxygenase-like cupin family protein